MKGAAHGAPFDLQRDVPKQRGSAHALNSSGAIRTSHGYTNALATAAARSGGDMMGRHERRADFARYRRDASRRDLLTFLVEPDDGLLATAPFLRRAARHWLDALSTRSRSCIVCSSWLWSEQSVGALLISTPATIRPTSAGTAAICRACWDADLPIDALERACASVLRSVVPNGRFEPHQDARR
jgi:hypothetical protein